MNVYDFNSVNNVADIGSAIINNWVSSLKETVEFINVEKDKTFQKKDIDYVWKYTHKVKGILEKYIELKVDRYEHTGNFFFETISNSQKNTPGCFMYTEADYMFYYFINKNQKHLYILKMDEVRPWFIQNKHRFKEKWLKTKVREGTYYSSCGSTVPIHTVLRECPSTREITLPSNIHSDKKIS